MRVLIQGAGIAGSTVAWYLAKAGATVTVLERAPQLITHGQNVDIEGAALGVIRRMGLYDEVKRKNTTEKGTRFIDSNGKPFAPFPVNDDSTMSPTSAFEILRGDLAIILYNATKAHEKITYKFGCTIDKVIENDGGSSCVRVHETDGTVEEYDVVVAADGQWSKLRKMCFDEQRDVQIVDKNMYIAYFTVPKDAKVDQSWWEVYQALGSRCVTTRPDPYGTTRAMFTYMPKPGQEKDKWQSMVLSSNREEKNKFIQEKFHDAGWQSERLLNDMHNATDFYFQAVQQIRLAKWSKGRVVCVGDSAYAPTPISGMGTSAALMGAYILAGEFATLKDDEHPVKAFDAYEEKFRPIVKEIQHIPSIFPGVIHPETSLHRWLFQTTISIVSRFVNLVLSSTWLRKRFDRSNEEEEWPMPNYDLFEKMGKSD